MALEKIREGVRIRGTCKAQKQIFLLEAASSKTTDLPNKLTHGVHKECLTKCLGHSFRVIALVKFDRENGMQVLDTLHLASDSHWLND